MRTAVVWGLLILPAGVVAQNDSLQKGDPPIIAWHFGRAGEPGITAADAKFVKPGPQPPKFPGFPADNSAMEFGAPHPSITIREADAGKADLRFRQGESITIEAWVKPAEIKNGSYVYIVGKGRNGRAGYPDKNQNYALRLKAEKGEYRLSYLFGSVATKDAPSDWHRWTSDRGFTSSEWHHVAVVYTFGKPKSIRGYVDGQAVTGTWDMGGATEKAPAVDDDHLTIGTGNGGGAGNSFAGRIDDLAIYRYAVDEPVLRNRYQFIPPPPVVRRDALPRGEVLVEIAEEGLPGANLWPDSALTAGESFREVAFGFFTVPHKYVDTGVRADRANPFLLRASALVEIPKGRHRLLLRGHGAARLHIENRLILTTSFHSGDGSGHGPILGPEKYLNLGPTFRFAPPGNREAWCWFESPGGSQLVSLETIVGSYLGKNRRRAELGETVVAISPAGSEDWFLLSPANRSIRFTDAGWDHYERERAAVFDERDRQARAALRKQHEEYWSARHRDAVRYVDSLPKFAVPTAPPGEPIFNDVDRFLSTRTAGVKAQQAAAEKGTVSYFRKIHPILESKCFSCHAGAGAKGGLRLDDSSAMRRGGSSDGPAVVPGKPGESALIARIRSHEPDTVMPPKGERLTAAEITAITTWIQEGAIRPEIDAEHFRVTELTDDLTFLRRAFLDIVGVVPSLEEIAEFTADRSPTKRARWIDRLLADPRGADHGMGYWLDVLAENPNILNPTLNNTGPFRWWIYESLRDHKPIDLMVTELLRMRGSERFGGPAGFAVASQNDSPFAAKGTIVAAAFLGVEMKCARCHDAPAHASKQVELFQLAAMLAGKSLKVPVTSSVPLDRIHEGGRKPLIQVTLKPGTEVPAKWPFEQFAPLTEADRAELPNDSRDRLAALITSPRNQRFAQVMVNRVWARLMGRGLVDPVDDWERGQATHPDLLNYLARDLVRNGYDLRSTTRFIMNSHAYQRRADPSLRAVPPLFTAPAHRRLGAEQIVDSLFAATGKPFRVEEVSLDIDGSRDLGNSISLGKPRRSWMLTSTSNERDRPSLSLPRVQAVADVLQAFGWRGARQDPLTVRETAANILQPAILQNGTMAVWLTRLSDDHALTAESLHDQPLESLIERVYLRMLTRKPTDAEREKYVAYLSPGYGERIRTVKPADSAPRSPSPYVSWSNHLHPQATVLKQAEEAAARAGDSPTTRLTPEWRERMEDFVWSLVNAPEFVLAP